MATTGGVRHDTTIFYPERIFIFIWFPSVQCFSIEHRYPSIFGFMLFLVMFSEKISSKITIKISPNCMYMVYIILSISVLKKKIGSLHTVIMSGIRSQSSRPDKECFSWMKQWFFTGNLVNSLLAVFGSVDINKFC